MPKEASSKNLTEIEVNNAILGGKRLLDLIPFASFETDFSDAFIVTLTQLIIKHLVSENGWVDAEERTAIVNTIVEELAAKHIQYSDVFIRKFVALVVVNAEEIIKGRNSQPTPIIVEGNQVHVRGSERHDDIIRRGGNRIRD